MKGGPHPRTVCCNRCRGTGIDNHATAKFRKGAGPTPCPKCDATGVLTAPDCKCGCGAPVSFRGSMRDGSYWTPYASPKCAAVHTQPKRSRSVRLNSAKRLFEDTTGEVWRRWVRRPGVRDRFEPELLREVEALVVLVAKHAFKAGEKRGYNTGYDALPREERVRRWAEGRAARSRTPAA